MDFSILIACYNEQDTIGLVLEYLVTHYSQIPIIVFDNCSTDNSSYIISKYPVHYLYEVAKGKGNAIRGAIKHITTPNVILIDADNEYDPAGIKSLLNYSYDMKLATVGIRPAKSMLLRSRIANFLIQVILWMRFNVWIKDCLSGLRLVPASILKETTATGFAIETEINKLCLQQQILINEVPINYKPRTIGKKIKARDMVHLTIEAMI